MPDVRSQTTVERGRHDLSQWPTGLADGLRLEELPFLSGAGLTPDVWFPRPRHIAGVRPAEHELHRVRVARATEAVKGQDGYLLAFTRE